MRRVLHLIHVTGPGGAETVCLDLVRGLDAGRWEHLVCVPEEGWITRELRRGGVEPVLLPTTDRRAFLRGIVRLLRERRVDLVQAHLLGSAFYASLAGMLARVPVVSTFHGSTDVNLARSLRSRARYGVIRGGSRRVVLVSEPLRAELLERRHLPPALLATIPNGIDTGVFRPRADRSFRREIGVRDDHVLVGAVGNLREAKDYPTFLRAAALLAARSPRYRFVVAGDDRGPLRGELLRLAGELGIADRVVLAGFRSDVHRVLNALDVFVVSSRSEGFSLAAVQAMASGVPVVATRCGGPEQILADGREGLLVGVGAPEEIAAAVERMREDAGLRDRLAGAALRRAADAFSSTGMVRRYEALYREVLGMPGEAGEAASAEAALAGAVGG
ncbi:MAG TPA: glycosyltransferase [Longimicrobiaceae bacterium]|nr:glycosyltransferase [Longimicrobiaceae bacterium]